MRGATVGLSDPGLYCLRMGFGLEVRVLGDEPDRHAPATPSKALSRLRVGFRFAAAPALAEMTKARGEKLPADVKAALEGDEARLQRFGRVLASVRRSFGHAPALEVVDEIVHETGYEAVLRARPDGRQALANLRAFRELIRSVQDGATPAQLVREVERLAEAGDDPAQAGLNLQPGAAVLVTVVHQAKGREWDAVVVPDLERSRVRLRVDGCDLTRLVERTKSGWIRRYLPASQLEDRSDLFVARQGAGGAILAEATRGAERAESRRLLYVACTRARRRLVLTARWPDQDRFARWMKELGTLALPYANTWLKDVVFALKMQLPDEAAAPLHVGDVWRDGTDFAWVRPAGIDFGIAPPAPASMAKASAKAIRLAAAAVTPVPLTVVNPSEVKPEEAPPAPPAQLVPPAVSSTFASETPFAGADAEGTAFHGVMQGWSYTGDCTRALVEQVVGEASPAVRKARVDRLAELVAVQAATQPALVDELRAAAARGDLFHEVDVGVPAGPGRRVEGAIDLLWRDQEGQWHVLDYKTSGVEAEGKLEEKTGAYWPQVHAYAEALRGRLPGGASVASVGLWFVGAGTVVRWLGV